MSEENENAPAPKPKNFRADLSTAAGIRLAMAKVIKQSIKGDIAYSDGMRLINMMSQLRQAISSEVLEERIVEIEKIVKERSL